MRMKGMRPMIMRLMILLVLSLASLQVSALPTVEDVQHAVHRGDYSAAQTMLREVLAAKPENARAHYILAEVLAHEGQLAEARTQAATAQRLDPAIHFTSPERFRQFQAELDGRANPAVSAAPSPRDASNSAGGSNLLWIVLALGAGAIWLMMRRRAAPPPGYAGNVPGGMPGGPGYPGYPSAPPAGGSGMGTVAAGLGGIAAGMVAEHLIEEALDRHHAGGAPPSFGRSAPESLEDRPIDFGSGADDWSGGSGNDGGGDAGGGFDSGSGSDWS